MQEFEDNLLEYSMYSDLKEVKSFLERELSIEDMFIKSRNRSIVDAKRLFALVIYEKYGQKIGVIGLANFMGYSNHSSVINLLKRKTFIQQELKLRVIYNKTSDYFSESIDRKIDVLQERLNRLHLDVKKTRDKITQLQDVKKELEDNTTN